jgi:hypothetical protein
MKFVIIILFSLFIVSGCRTAHRDDAEGSVIEITHHHISDAKEGESVQVNVFFTSDGHAFIWPYQDQGGPEHAWRRGGRWYSTFSGYVRPTQMTGYSSIQSADGTPVTFAASAP